MWLSNRPHQEALPLQQEEIVMVKGSKTICKFKFVRDTKGAVLYQEVNGNGAELKTSDPECTVGSLYIRKLALQKHFGSDIPQTVTAELVAS